MSGHLETAATLSVELERRASRIGAPWALALAFRCEGLIADAHADPERAVVAFQRALEHHAQQDRPPAVRARKLLLGRALRRARRKRAAREALERSIQGFEMIGAALWARRARQELSRIGGRTAAPEQTRGFPGLIMPARAPRSRQ